MGNAIGVFGTCTCARSAVLQRRRRLHQSSETYANTVHGSMRKTCHGERGVGSFLLSWLRKCRDDENPCLVRVAARKCLGPCAQSVLESDDSIHPPSRVVSL